MPQKPARALCLLALQMGFSPLELFVDLLLAFVISRKPAMEALLVLLMASLQRESFVEPLLVALPVMLQKFVPETHQPVPLIPSLALELFVVLPSVNAIKPKPASAIAGIVQLIVIKASALFVDQWRIPLIRLLVMSRKRAKVAPIVQLIPLQVPPRFVDLRPAFAIRPKNVQEMEPIAHQMDSPLQAPFVDQQYWREMEQHAIKRNIALAHLHPVPLMPICPLAHFAVPEEALVREGITPIAWEESPVLLEALDAKDIPINARPPAIYAR